LSHIIRDTALPGCFIPAGEAAQTGPDIQAICFQRPNFEIPAAFMYPVQKGRGQLPGVALFFFGTSVYYKNIHISFSSSGPVLYAVIEEKTIISM